MNVIDILIKVPQLVRLRRIEILITHLMIGDQEMAKFIAMAFLPIWIGLTIPISLSIVFTLLKSIVLKDTTGLSMVAITIMVSLLNIYVGVKIFEKKIQPWSDKRKKRSHYPYS